MTYRLWSNARPMVPNFDYDGEPNLPDEQKSWLGRHFGHHGDGVRHVQTPEGARQYGQPIGTVIHPDPKPSPGGWQSKWTGPAPPASAGRPKKPYPVALGSVHGRADGLDTPVSAFGMRYEAKVAQHPLVKQAKASKGWGSVPTTDYPLTGNLIATEEFVRSGPIKKVLDGEPLRSGYDPEILRTDAGDILVDGHHRAVMHPALGHTSMPAKVLDLRGGKALDKAFADAKLAEENRRAAAAAAAEAQLQEQATQLAQAKVDKAAAAEPNITPLIEDVVSAHGGYMDGLEHRLKTFDSTREKILRVAHRKRIGASSAAGQISDVLRYTGVLPTGNYSEGVKATLDALRQAGFSPTVTNNYWPKGDAYSGLNILLYGKGQDLEIQFHTPESLAAKAANHLDYEISRDDTKPLEERRAAWDRMIPKWDDVPQPPGWLDFGSLFIYDPPGGGRGRYVSKWEAQGLPEPPRPAKVSQETGFGDDELAEYGAPELFGSKTGAPFYYGGQQGKGAYPWSKKG